MKKGTSIMLITLFCGIFMVVGIFIGRNQQTTYHRLLPNTRSWISDVPQEKTDILLDINTASKAQLMELPGIGEEIAERIIQYRTENGPFEAIQDLLNVKGIGEEKLQTLDGRIKIGG